VATSLCTWEQFVDGVGRVILRASGDVGKVVERVDPARIAGRDEGRDCLRAVARLGLVNSLQSFPPPLSTGTCVARPPEPVNERETADA